MNRGMVHQQGRGHWRGPRCIIVNAILQGSPLGFGGGVGSWAESGNLGRTQNTSAVVAWKRHQRISSWWMSEAREIGGR
jgi:hypothetical protein